jgi:UDP-N-acetylmuramoylalanine--D-glutamate ligase
MILVIGYGVSGKAAMKLLRKRGMAAIAVDKKPEAGVLLDSADLPLEGISQVIVSPGVLPSHPLVLKARNLGIEVIGEIEFALRFTKNRCVGITGSNGKTTTTLLTAHALSTAGIKAQAVGNVGTALSSVLLDPDPEEILIIELSSFQLETMREKKFEIAAYLNLSPNHLDRHASMEEYAAAKANIQNCLKPGGKLLVSEQVWRSFRDTLKLDNVEIFGQSLEKSGSWFFLPEQNVCAAAALCASFGVSRETFDASLPMFEKPPHRIEWVAESAGIRYYNDSKATSIEAVIHAVSCFCGPVVLIVGGVDKGSPYLPWIDPFRGKVKKIVAYGQASAKIQKELEPFYLLDRVSTLSEAVMSANRSAAAGDTILLSPGCSSYDQFRSYEHRGDEFKKLVQETIGVHS